MQLFDNKHTKIWPLLQDQPVLAARKVTIYHWRRKLGVIKHLLGFLGKNLVVERPKLAISLGTKSIYYMSTRPIPLAGKSHSSGIC